MQSIFPSHKTSSLAFSLQAGYFPFSLDILKQLPCVSIEVCLKGNDKSKMSKSLVT